MKPLWIDTPTQLAEACAQWQTRDWISVDTEFVRINTYRAQLCLVQIGDGSLNACIDPLAIDDLTPMWALMAKAAAGKSGDAFYDTKLKTGRYFLDRWVPEAGMHLGKVKAGAGSMMALDAEEFYRSEVVRDLLPP